MQNGILVSSFIWERFPYHGHKLREGKKSGQPEDADGIIHDMERSIFQHTLSNKR